MSQLNLNKDVRQCGICVAIKEITEFQWRKDSGNYRKNCKACEASRLRKYRAEHPEKWQAYYGENREQLLAQKRQRYQDNAVQHRNRAKAYRENNPDYVATYEQENKERIRERKRKYYLANKTHIDARNRDHYNANKGAALARYTKRRARKANAEGQYTKDDIKKQYESQRGKCWYCLTKLDDSYHVDHRIPLARGGSNYPGNLVVACGYCNRSKSDKFPHEWDGRLL